MEIDFYYVTPISVKTKKGASRIFLLLDCVRKNFDDFEEADSSLEQVLNPSKLTLSFKKDKNIHSSSIFVNRHYFSANSAHMMSFDFLDEAKKEGWNLVSNKNNILGTQEDFEKYNFEIVEDPGNIFKEFVVEELKCLKKNISKTMFGNSVLIAPNYHYLANYFKSGEVKYGLGSKNYFEFPSFRYKFFGRMAIELKNMFENEKIFDSNFIEIETMKKISKLLLQYNKIIQPFELKLGINPVNDLNCNYFLTAEQENELYLLTVEYGEILEELLDKKIVGSHRRKVLEMISDMKSFYKNNIQNNNNMAFVG